jgi:hypothetical protein
MLNEASIFEGAYWRGPDKGKDVIIFTIEKQRSTNDTGVDFLMVGVCPMLRMCSKCSSELFPGRTIRFGSVKQQLSRVSTVLKS